MEWINRWQEKRLREALGEQQVVILSGARQVGKTALAKKISQDSIYRNLDDMAHLQFAQQDAPSFLLSGEKSRLMVIDEIQRAPALLQAIKLIVDERKENGQFLLTGSADVRKLPTVTESLAGRVAHVNLYPIAEGELAGISPTFLKRLETMDFPSDLPALSRKDLIYQTFRGGYPKAIEIIDDSRRARWHRGYVQTLMEQDLEAFPPIRKWNTFYKLIYMLAIWSSSLSNINELSLTLELSRPTLQNYLIWLESLHIMRTIPVWRTQDREGLKRRDKFFMTDSGLMTSMLRWNAQQIEFDGDRLGKLIETAIGNELIAQIAANGDQSSLFHYRDTQRREIDFIIDDPTGMLVAIEVKAGRNVGPQDFLRLKWFEENQAKGRPFRGIVLYNGPNRINFGNNYAVLPLSTLWAK
jgi:predicted AAA+ superfamily ATPase